MRRRGLECRFAALSPPCMCAKAPRPADYWCRLSASRTLCLCYVSDPNCRSCGKLSAKLFCFRPDSFQISRIDYSHVLPESIIRHEPKGEESTHTPAHRHSRSGARKAIVSARSAEVMLLAKLDGYEFCDAAGIYQRVDHVFGCQLTHRQCLVAFEGCLNGAPVNALDVFRRASTTNHSH